MKKITFLIILLSNISFAQVGIGTVNPQQQLHVAGSTSTIRIESQNTVNEPVLNGGVELAPLFVTPEGDFTIQPPGYDPNDTAGELEPLNFLISVDNFIDETLLTPPGVGVIIANDASITNASSLLATIPFSSPQNALIEVRYVMTLGISSLPFTAVGAGTTFSDVSVRTVRTYFHIDLNSDGLDAAELSKFYGLHGEAYSSFFQGSIGYAFIHGIGYGSIPAGNHSLVFFGETEDGDTKETYIGFGGSADNLKIRIHN